MFSLFLLVILPVCRALKEMDHGKSGAQFEADFIKCLDEAALDLNFLRRVANKSFRYMHLYDAGATGALAEFANRKYQGHRCPPKSWLTAALKTEYKAKYKQHAKDSMIDWKQLKADQEAQRALVGSQQPPASNRRRKKRARSPSAAPDAAPAPAPLYPDAAPAPRQLSTRVRHECKRKIMGIQDLAPSSR